MAAVKTASTLQLPFWLFRFAEFTEVVLRGQRGSNDETELLRDLIAEAKERYAQGGDDQTRLVKRRYGRNGFTADSPVPYRIADLMKVIEERQGLLEGKREKPLLSSLKARLMSITTCKARSTHSTRSTCMASERMASERRVQWRCMR